MLRLVPPVDGADSFELDPVTPRDLPAFRAELRKQLDAENPEPTPMLHTAETVDLLARALPGARELGLAARPHPSDDELAVDEDVELDAGDLAEARDRLAGAHALLDALQSDYADGLEPDELSIRHVVRAEMAERNRAAFDAFREVNMLPLRRADLSEGERALLDASMPELRTHIAHWESAGVTIEDLVGVVVGGLTGSRPEVVVCTRGAYRRFAVKDSPLSRSTIVSAVTKRSGWPGMSIAPNSLIVVVWSAEQIGSGAHASTKPATLTEVTFRTGN